MSPDTARAGAGDYRCLHIYEMRHLPVVAVARTVC
eukprot:SAG11_NODE_17581_length_514_cov_0.995181_1_plen_34_part_10